MPSVRGCSRERGDGLPSPCPRIRRAPLRGFALRRLLLVGLLAIGVAHLLRAADAGPVEERLRRLEQRMEQLEQENRELRRRLDQSATSAPSLAPRHPWPVGVATPGADEKKFTVGGVFQGQAEFGRAADLWWNGIRDRFFSGASTST